MGPSTFGGLLNFFSGNLTRRTLLFVLIRLIFLSYFGMLASAIFLFPSLPRLHEMCARTAALGIGTGLIALCLCALKGYFIPAKGKKLYQCWLLISWIVLTLGPILGLAFSECLLLIMRAHLLWSYPLGWNACNVQEPTAQNARCVLTKTLVLPALSETFSLKRANLASPGMDNANANDLSVHVQTLPPKYDASEDRLR
jgi:hypothetical protein